MFVFSVPLISVYINSNIKHDAFVSGFFSASMIVSNDEMQGLMNINSLI